MPLGGARWANFFAGKPLEAPRRANFVAHAGAPAHVRSLRCSPCLQWWGFCTTRSRCTACCWHVVQFPPLLSAASGFVCAPGFPRVLMGAHTFSLCSRNVTVSQVCSRHIQRRLCHRIRAGTPAQGASITSTTTRHDRERSPHNPGSQPAGYTTQHRAPEPVGCEPRSSDGSPPSQRADHTDHNDQATQSNSR